MLAKQRNFKLSAKQTRVLIIHTKYAESGGECSVALNEAALLKQHGYNIKVLHFDNRRLKLISVLLMPFNVVSFIQVLVACLKFRPALVHIHNTHFAASHAIVFAVKLLNIPVVKTLHNYRLLCPSATLFFRGQLFLKSLDGSFPWQAVKDKVYRDSHLLTYWLAYSNWVHRKIGTWKLINKFFVFTEQGRQLFLNSNLDLKNSQLIIKPNFAERNNVPSVKRATNFLYIGRLSPEKGILVLLEAFSYNGLPLTIIGDGIYASSVKKAMELNPLIEWKGYQDKKVINRELKKCDALIFPSICYEGMPVTIIEAFASETPVISSRLGSMEQMVQHNCNGLLFEAGNAESLNEQLLNWKKFSLSEKQYFSRNALKAYRNKYTPEKNIGLLLSVYNDLISKKEILFKKSYWYKSERQHKQLNTNSLNTYQAAWKRWTSV